MSCTRLSRRSTKRVTTQSTADGKQFTPFTRWYLVPWNRVPSHKFAALDAAAGVAPPWRGARPRLRRRALAATPIARKLPQGTTVPGD